MTHFMRMETLDTELSLKMDTATILGGAERRCYIMVNR